MSLILWGPIISGKYSLYKAVLADIQRYAGLAVEDEKKLIDRLLKANYEFKNKNLQRYEKNIRESKNRIKEIDGLIQNLFEEKVAGTISDVIFKRMAKKYEDDQARLIADLEQLENEFYEYKRIEQDLTGWIKRIKECLAIDNLTRSIVIELIDRIEVSETYKKDGEESLDIHIFYKFGLKEISGGPQKKNEPVETIRQDSSFNKLYA